MKKTLDRVLRLLAMVSLGLFAVAAVIQAGTGNDSASYAYMCAAAWAVIYLVMRKEDA